MVKSLPPQVAALQSSIEAITADLHSLDASLKRADDRHNDTDARFAALKGRDGRLDDMAAQVASLKDKVDQHRTLIDANVASFDDVFARLAALEDKTGHQGDKLKDHDDVISDLSARNAETDDAMNDLVDHVIARTRIIDAKNSELSHYLVSMNENTQKLFDRAKSLECYVEHTNCNDLTSVVYKPQPRFTRSEHDTSSYGENVAAYAETPLVAGLGEAESVHNDCNKSSSEEANANEVEHAESTSDDHIATNIKRSDTLSARLKKLESTIKAHEVHCSEEHALQHETSTKAARHLDFTLGQNFDSYLELSRIGFNNFEKRLSVLETVVPAAEERLSTDNHCLGERITALTGKLEHSSADSVEGVYVHLDDVDYRIRTTEEKCISHLEDLAVKLNHRIDTLQKAGASHYCKDDPTQNAHLLEHITSLEDRSETGCDSLASASLKEATSRLGSLETADEVNSNEDSETKKSAELQVIDESIYAKINLLNNGVKSLAKVHDMNKILVKKMTADMEKGMKSIMLGPKFVHVADAPVANPTCASSVDGRVGIIDNDHNSASELADKDNNAHGEASLATNELLDTATTQPEVEVVEFRQGHSSGVTATPVEAIQETVRVGRVVEPEPLRILNTDSIRPDGTAKGDKVITVVDAVATLLCSSTNAEKHKFEDLVNLDVRVARYAATVKYWKWGVLFEDRSCQLEFDFLREGQTIQVSYALLPAEFRGKRNLVYKLGAAGKWEPKRLEFITTNEEAICPGDFNWFARRAELLCKELLMATKLGQANGDFQSGDYI